MKRGEIQQYYLRCFISDVTGWEDPQKKLAKAFAQNEFLLYCQSIHKLKLGGDNRPHLEIFVRLKEEEQNLMPPGTFLPILEHYKLGPKLDQYVLRQALVWHRSNRRDVGSVIHINLCQGTLADPEFPSFVLAELKATGCRGESLCFEIPDVNKPCDPVTCEFAKRLKAGGCSIAVGVLEPDHMSLEPVKDLAADFMKIGGSVTRDIVGNKAVTARIRALARACRAFGIQTIAQHVEDPDTLNMLTGLGVDYAQGYGISKPEPI